MRKPSQKSIDLYNRLIAEQNKARKQLSRIHKRAEETLGSGRLPALIIPRRARKIRANQFEGLSPSELHKRLKQYWVNLATLKEQFSKGLQSYLAKTVKDGYMELWRDQIERHSGETPDVFNGYLYSKQQIEDSEYGEFMRTYNKLFMLSPLVFLAMLYSGRLLQFKYIYRELEKMSAGGAEGSWLQEQNELLVRGPKEQAKLVQEVIDEEYGKDYKHSKSTKKKAEEKSKR